MEVKAPGYESVEQVLTNFWNSCEKFRGESPDEVRGQVTVELIVTELIGFQRFSKVVKWQHSVLGTNAV